MEFKLKYTVECEVGDLIVQNEYVGIIIRYSDDSVGVLDLINGQLEGMKYRSIHDLLRNEFNDFEYRIVKNENISLIEN